MKSLKKGFTLFEVMVALAVIGIGMGAVMSAVSMMVEGNTQLRQQTLALWVAQNRLAERQIRHDFPDIGFASGKAQQAGQTFEWRETIGNAGADFRRVEIKVYTADEPDFSQATLVGYLIRVQS